MTITIAKDLLLPPAVLILWSLIVLFWTMKRRMPALRAAKLPREAMIGGRGQDLDAVLPKKVNWPAHNYTNLMEQPTLYYPVVFLLALLGQATTLNIALAWAYVGLRIVHSFWQINVNTIPLRASLFALYTLVLLFLAVNAVLAAAQG